MVKRSDGRWREAITVNGKRKYFYGKTKAEVYAKIKAFDESKGSERLFKLVAESWQAVHREEIGEKTWMNYKPHYEDIVSIHGERDIGDITALDITNDLKRHAAQKYSATVIGTRRSIYRMILDHALLAGLITYNPAIGVTMPKGVTRNRREAPAEGVFQTIMQNAKEPFGLFPALLACTGLRKAEALALTWGDVKDGYISVTKALDYTVHAHPVVKQPKTKAGVREVPIMAVLAPLLVRPKGAKDTDLLFPSKPSNRNPNAGGYMTEREYEGAWKRYCAAAGLVDGEGKPTIGAHQLRHGMATMGFEAGVDELTMQAILGHASPTTTRDIYTHLRNKKRVKSVEALDKAMAQMSQGNTI